ncbi:lysine--tRNA ligase [Candidatus Woesearchaeota archaeon]|nr:lysine--tRNA ligase [Candidatus Woesearchaeota archaeon]
MDPEQQLINERKKKLKTIRELGINPYPYSFDVKDNSKDILEKNKDLENENKSKVSLAGRIVSMRKMGKINFAHLQDQKGKIQIFVANDNIDKIDAELFKNLDVGDIIGIEGNVFRTKAGEITINTKKLTLLTKSLRPLPEKWHGLKDVEIRYRKRYLDLISNQEVKEIFIKRTKIIDSIRDFLNKKGFLEVETPILQPIYGGAAARPFKTFVHDIKADAYLSISPELYLKRLTVGGLEKVYTICKNFRNESIDRFHNPEFTMIELYCAYVDYNDMMALTEEIVSHAAKEVNGTTKTKFGDNLIDFKIPWKRITMKDALKEYAKLDVEKMKDEELKKKVKELKLKDVKEERGFMIQALFEELVEDKLIQPTFITEYPKSVCPLTKEHRKDSFWVERFEAYVAGMELANAYSELNDPVEQEKRFKEQLKEKKGHEDPHLMVHKVDHDFLEALDIGMPPLGGVGIGIDRLVLLITGQESLRDIILFPFMKYEES